MFILRHTFSVTALLFLKFYINYYLTCLYISTTPLDQIKIKLLTSSRARPKPKPGKLKYCMTSKIALQSNKLASLTSSSLI